MDPDHQARRPDGAQHSGPPRTLSPERCPREATRPRTTWVAGLRPGPANCTGVGCDAQPQPRNMACTVLLVNPWWGLAGPSIGLRQIAVEGKRRGHDLHLLVPAQDAQLLGQIGGTLHVARQLSVTPRSSNPFKLGRHLLAASRESAEIAALARRVGAQLVCINSENMLLQPWAARLARAASVVIVRGLRFAELGAVGRGYFAVQRGARATYIAVSHTVRRALLELGVDSERVVTIYNGVDLEQFAPGPADPELRRELDIVPDHAVVGTICHLVPRKGAHHLIEIMGHLVQRTPAVTCLLVGTDRGERPEYLRQLQERIDACNVRENVRLLGSREDIPALLRQLDILIHPSETESFGRTIAEAMATGLPVVGFRVGAVPELIDDRRTGYVVPAFQCADAAEVVAGLLADPRRRRDLGSRARAKAEREYDLRTSVDRIWTLLESLCSRR
jgi:glycosyltransferase involved in cell wall biosynthesis